MGEQEVASDHHVLATMTATKPADATVSYSITAGNDEGVFELTRAGKLMLNENAVDALETTYHLTVEGIGTLKDGSATNKSDATITVNIIPTVGVFGDTTAVRGTTDMISLTFERYGGDLSKSLTVDYYVDLTPTGGARDAIMANDLYDISQDHAWVDNQQQQMQIVIQSGQRSATITLYAAILAGDEEVAGIRSGEVYVEQSSDGYGTAITAMGRGSPAWAIPMPRRQNYFVRIYVSTASRRSQPSTAIQG